MKRILPIILTFLLAVPQIAFAEEEIPESRIVKIKGHTGFWFAEETATRMLADLKKLPELELKIEKYELRAKLSDDRIALLKEDIKLTQEIGLRWENSFNQQIKINEMERKQYREDLERLNKWYRSPPFWAGVGFVLGAVLAVGLSFGLSKSTGE